jgi:glycolate oxidase iron-sulfur subunit
VSTTPTQSKSWFDGEDAPSRGALETCIHCGLCLTACPTYRTLKIEPDSPRGRLYLMRGLSEGRIEPSPELEHHLDLCLGCRACEPVCPAGVPYGQMLEETRGQLARRRPSRGPLERLGRWVLTQVIPRRERAHFAADLLRLGQGPALSSFVRSRLARRTLPEFAVRGYEMTPAIPARADRDLSVVAGALPPGAHFEPTAEALIFKPAGTPKARAAFFTTCVMETMFPRVNQEAVRLLVLAGCEVVSPRVQGCCGALQAHAGLRRSARHLARENARAFGGAYDFVVNTSAGCGAALHETGHLLRDDSLADEGAALSRRARDVSQVLFELGLPQPAIALHGPKDPARPLRVGYHDPCHLAHAQNVRREPRALLAALPGVELRDLRDPDFCCGSAGVYNLTQPEMAEAQLARKLDTIEELAPDIVIASNPGCLLHMSRGARERGLPTQVRHLVELLGMAYPSSRAPSSHS